MSLPDKYKWLKIEPGPRMLVEALKLFGTKEVVGTGDNSEILQWAMETGLNRVYSADAVPWCGLFMAVVAQRAGKEWPKNPLWARNWAGFGQGVVEAMLGDVLVFVRPGGGHVAIYVGEDDASYHVLGGNQSDAVTITRIANARCIAIRRPIYSVAQPPNVRKIFLKSSGIISSNEQ